MVSTKQTEVVLLHDNSLIETVARRLSLETTAVGEVEQGHIDLFVLTRLLLGQVAHVPNPYRVGVPTDRKWATR